MLELSKPLFIGVFGTSGTDKLSSTLKSVTIVTGAGGTTPAEPTADVYAQILDLIETYNQENEAIRAAEGERQAEFDANETSRGATFSAAEAARQSNETSRIAAEGLRGTTFTQNEAARQAAYSEAEAARDSDYADAESARDVLYDVAEGTRQENETARIAAEALRAENYSTFSTRIAKNTASIDKLESNLINANPNGEARVSMPDTYAPTVTLPKNATGTVQATLYGATEENIITYDTTTWAGVGY